MSLWSKFGIGAEEIKQELEQQKLQHQYAQLMKMGAALGVGSQQQYKPPPPPVPVHVGGDFAWQSWVMKDPTHGPVLGWLHKDLFIPESVVHRILRAPVPDGWYSISIEEQREYIYLEARKLLIIGT